MTGALKIWREIRVFCEQDFESGGKNKSEKLQRGNLI